MTRVIIRNVVLDDGRDEISDNVSNVGAFLFDRFKTWPRSARLYQDAISNQNEIPVNSPEDVGKLESLKGNIYVVIYPEGFAAIGIALIAATVAINLISRKSKKSSSNAATPAIQRESPNNSLSERVNSNRLGGRIPDIYGEVLSTPDLIGQPYFKYENNKKVEYAYLCVGRGEHDIAEVRDDKTLLSRITGASAEVYGPNTSPNSGATQLLIGDAITEPLRTAIKSNDVTGQTLDPPPTQQSTVYDFTDSFVIDNVQILYFNMISNDIQGNITFRVIVEELDSNDVVTDTVTTDFILVGSAAASAQGTFTINPGFTGKVQVRMARKSYYPGNPDYEIPDPAPDPFPDEAYLQDTLQWESMYSVQNVTENDFGNITSIYVRTVANDTALEIKSRKLNVRATRKVGIVQTDNSVGAAAGSKRFLDILVAMALDTKIGNRQLSELDVDNFRLTYNAVVNYFGSTDVGEFSYTFDDDNLSFEEMASIVAENAFSTLYRRGSLIKMFFEQSVSGSTLLFNHRNKLPGTEVRNVSFGNLDDKDGVELKYVDDEDGAPLIWRLPTDLSAVNPDKIDQLGVQNKLQAYFHAHRYYNRILYQNTAVEFDATQEALLVIPNERVLVADNTRPNTFDGEVIAVDGLVLTLSQNVDLIDTETWVIFLQTINGTVDVIDCTQGTERNQIVLDRNPVDLLSTASENYALATYEITQDTSPRLRAFLAEEKEPRDNFVTTIRAVNYDERYYQNDKDLINNVIDSNAETL